MLLLCLIAQKMVRAPCCEKMGLKKGPWTPEEDQTLITYIHRHGHANWRALPKQAGLLRCGKSCRLRWTNYLRPDIKRGNFSTEEEETIIKLHQMLGNRWSAIAARLPGRTDNEIKNVWHTHLKKKLKLKLKQNQASPEAKHQYPVKISKCESESTSESEPMNYPNQQRFDNQNHLLVLSPQQSSSDFSSGADFSAATVDNHDMNMKNEYTEIDENFWSEAFPTENFSMEADLPAITTDPCLQIPTSPVSMSSGSNLRDMDFWYNLLMEAGELQ